MKRLFAVLLLALPMLAASLQQKMDAYLAPYIERNAFNGVVLVGKGDQVVLVKGYGMANYEFGIPNTAETRFAIASITKRFTRVVIAKLVEEGKLSEDDLLAKWAPDFPKADRITVGMLIRHMSGIRDPQPLRRVIRASYTPAEVVEVLKTLPLGSEPGAQYSYTTANYAVLAHIIERVTGQTFAQVVRKYVYEPAGMRDSGELDTVAVVPRLANGYMPDPYTGGIAVCGPEDISWKTGGGSSYTTARDLMRFARALYTGRLVPKPLELIPPSVVDGKRVAQSGGAFPGAGANLLYDVDDEVTVVVLNNNYATVAGTVAPAILRLFLGRDAPNPRLELAASQDFDPRLIGTWDVPDRGWVYIIGVRNGRPYAGADPLRRSAILRMKNGRWFLPLDWQQMEVKFDDVGKVSEAWLYPPGAEQPLKMVRRP
ncbi:MAG TPA: serine hydrolase domain-containing protein [Thermoanaerobaculia bacterium]|nr:serine hydrolase domain-containing protein [Thermoanaerobaculia bacterium]